MPCHVSPAIDPQIFTTLENMSVAAKPVNSSRTTGTRKDQNNNSNAATIGSRNTNHNNSTGEGSMKDVEECWTHYFVPPEYEVHGENFDYYLRTLLRTKDKVAMRRAMESYAKNKNLHALVLSVHAILSDPKKWTLWYFVLQSLKTRERLICRAKLIELLQKYSAAVEHSQNSSGDKASDEDIPTNSENRTCIGDTGNARSRIRRRRSERPTYVRSNTSHCISSTVNRQEADLNPPIDETSKNAEIRTTFRVRRRQRRRTVTGLEADDVDSPPRIDSDILRIDESEEDDMSQLVCSLDKLTETIEKSTASVRQDRATDISRRRRRRDPLLRRLQSVESFSKKEVATKSVGTYVTTDETEVTVKPRERRRRSSDGSSFRNSNKPTTELRVTDSKQGNSSSIPVTQIDEVTISDSPPRAETARRRRRSSTASIVVSHDRNSCPQTSIDDIIAHPENDSNSNVNSNTQVSSSYSEDSNETDSSMSLKSPMNRLRSSFRLPKSKSKEHNDAKHVDTKTTGSGDDKGETKKSRKGLLERMGMGKSKQSNAEQKKQSKKSKSSSKKEDKSKDKTTVSKSKSVDAKTTETTKNGLSQTKEESPEQFTDNMFMLNMTTTTPEFLQDDCKPNNLTRRLTFSRPPKNADTETFLNELYAQFDKDMNLLGNLDLDFDSGSQPTNFGSKWSYLPNGSMPDDNSQKVFQPDEGFVRNDLSDLNLSDLEDTVDSTPPFPLNLDSGDESGLGTVETISTPSPVVHASTGTRDRELEWERRERRKRRGRRNTVDTNTSQNEQQYSPQHSVQQQTFQRLHSAPQNSYSSVTSDTQDEENIYQVPKTTTRRSRGNRKQPRADFSRFFSLPSDTSHPPITKVTRRQRYRGYTPDSESGNLWESQSRVADENYVDMPQNNGADQTTSNGSTEQRSFYDRTQKRGFISRDTENVISEPGDSFSSDHDVPDGQHSDFAGEVRDPSDERRRRRTRDNVPVTHLPATTSGDVYLYVDDKVVYASPHSTQSTAVRLRRRSRKKSDPQQNDDLEGDLSFTDMDSLLKQCEDEMNSDEERPPEVPPLPDSETPPPIPPPPSSDGPGIPPPPIPPPPPPPPPLPPMFNINQSTNSPEHQINVKRINWQKIETRDLNETVWGQMEDFETINDVVKYLDLEQHFATKKAKDLRRFSLPVKRETTSILSHKKAYNISILLAHLKMTVNELRGMLLSSNNNHLDSEQYKQLLMYAPDDDEAAKLLVFKGNVSKLNEADQFARKLVAIPGFKLRLQSLKFKQSFAEREEEVRKNLDHILQASMQLRKSRKLAKILEFVLAMGNYMNRGHNRIAKATGFKIQFLNNMDSTKTSDNKLTFLHILARAVSSKFPELLNFFDDMRDVKPASRVLYPAVFQELQDMRMEWVEIRDRMSETTTKEVRGDRFKSVMENCLVKTNASLKRLELLLTTTIKEFNKVAKFFGENPKTIGMQQFFGIFDGFITKFEKASNEILYIMKNKGNNTGT